MRHNQKYEIYECSDILEQRQYYGYEKKLENAEIYVEKIMIHWEKQKYRSNLVIIKGDFRPSNVIKDYSNKQ